MQRQDAQFSVEYKRLINGSDIEIDESDSLIPDRIDHSSISAKNELHTETGKNYQNSLISNWKLLGGRKEPLPFHGGSKHPFQYLSNKLIRLLIFLIGFIILFAIYYDSSSQAQKSSGVIRPNKNKIKYEANSSWTTNEYKQSRWLVGSSKCHIPEFKAWDPSIRLYVDRRDPLDCPALFNHSKFKEPLSIARDNKLYFNKVGSQNMSSEHFKCCYHLVKRGDDDDEVIILNDHCIPWTEDGLEAPGSLIKVVCDRPRKYDYVHSFIKMDPHQEANLDNLVESRLNKEDSYNVVIVGFDTMSRLNMLRQLEETFEVLEKEYNVIKFYGFNKVGENTFPNLVPMLLGMEPQQLVDSGCWKGDRYHKSNNDKPGNKTFDNCRFIWDSFRELGYRTYYSEDWPAASTFNYIKEGFMKQPTDQYMRPFVLARDAYAVPKAGKRSCTPCNLNKASIELDLENLKNFIKSSGNKPYFAFHWNNCPFHDDLNGGSFIDNFSAKFFSGIKELTHEKRTFVIFLSDHGYRWRTFISSRIGHYEASLPMLNIAPPKLFIERHPELVENLKMHQNSLLTPFDIYDTLLSLRDLGAKEKIRPNKRFPFQKGITGERFKQNFSTLSILEQHSPLELDRSCKDTGIPDNFCVCHEFDMTSVHGTEVIGAALFYVYGHLYELLTNHFDKCHELEFEEIEEAQEYNYEKMLSFNETGGNSDKNFPTVEYNLRLKTSPNDAVFQEVIRLHSSNLRECQYEILRVKEMISEPTLAYELKHKLTMEMNKICGFSVNSGSIARLNLYGNQSACVEGLTELKKICLCKSEA